MEKDSSGLGSGISTVEEAIAEDALNFINNEFEKKTLKKRYRKKPDLYFLVKWKLTKKVWSVYLT